MWQYSSTVCFLETLKYVVSFPMTTMVLYGFPWYGWADSNQMIEMQH